MPIGWTAPIFHIYHCSCLLLWAVDGVLYLGVHHSRIENCISLIEGFVPVKCLETGVTLLSLGLLTESLCSYILCLNALPVSPT